MTNLFAKIQRLGAGALAIAASAAVAWTVWPITPEGPAQTVETAFSGTLLLEQHTCRRGEFAGLVVRGVEDGYRPGNREEARFERSAEHRRANVGVRNYDDPNSDAELFDYFELPTTTVSGLFVIRMTPPEGRKNDSMTIGRYADALDVDTQQSGSILRSRVDLIEFLPGWSRRADIYWAALGDVELYSGETLIDIVRAPDSDGVIDLKVTDDTVVDFAGIAFCTEPIIRSGVTFWVDPVAPSPEQNTISPLISRDAGYVVATCENGPETSHACEPYLGDIRCNRSLPLICYRPDQYPFPRDIDLVDRLSPIGDGYWSAGELALTRPVPGEQFATIDEADEFCRAEFGDSWRVADFHLDPQGYRFWGIGQTRYSGRAWVDIRDQPYGTCWSRS